MFQEHVSLPCPTPISSFPPRTSLLDAEIEIPSLCERFHTLCRQHTSPPSLDQRVPTFAQHTQALGGHQHNNILALDQSVPVLDQQIIPVLNQDVPMLDQDDILALAPALDQDSVPALPAPLDQDFGSVLGNSSIDYNYMLPVPVSAFTDEERGKMEETATDAMEELARLLRMNEPFWFRSMVDGKFILQRESYEKIFHRPNRLRGTRVRRESSKDSRLVIMNGTQLVDMFLDSVTTSNSS